MLGSDLPPLPTRPLARRAFLAKDRMLRSRVRSLAARIGVSIRPGKTSSGDKLRFTGWVMSYHGVAVDIRPEETLEAAKRGLIHARGEVKV